MVKVWKFWDDYNDDRKLDIIIESLSLLNAKVTNLEKKENLMAGTLLDAIHALQAEVGDVVVAEKAAIDMITKLVADLAAANDAGNVDAVNSAITDLKAETDALNALMTPVVAAPPPVVEPTV